jgi:hypothetical protein
MAPSIQKQQDGLVKQDPNLRPTSKANLTVSAPNATKTRIYYPDTQFQNMESAMRPRGGYVDTQQPLGDKFDLDADSSTLHRNPNTAVPSIMNIMKNINAVGRRQPLIDASDGIWPNPDPNPLAQRQCMDQLSERTSTRLHQ